MERNQSGSTAVEFALVAPVLIIMITGIMMLSIAYYRGATVQWSLERTLRAAMIDPDVGADEIEDMLAADLERIGSPEFEFEYDIDNSGSVPFRVVRVTYDAPLEIPLLPDLSLRFSAENVAPAPAS